MNRRFALQAIMSGTVVALLGACTTAPAAPPSAPTAAPKPTTPPAPAPTTAAATSAPAAAPTAQPKPTAPATTAVQPTSAPAAQAKSGGTLRLGMVGDVSTLDGHNTTPNQFDTTWSVFDRLISYDAKLQPQPELAESWDLSSDLTQIKLNLRKGVQWHSGREFTSDDVKYNLLRVRDAKLQIPTLRNQSNWFTTIDTPDKYTIVLKSDLPRPAIFDFFEYFNQVDKDTMEGPNAKTTSIGTGPFKFVEWVQGDHLTFARNPNYWQSGRPYLDSFVASPRDAQAMLVQFEVGRARHRQGPAAERLRALPRRPDVPDRSSTPVSGNYFLFGLNLGIPPLDNKQVRQALNYALDRKRFVDTFMFGTGTAAVAAVADRARRPIEASQAELLHVRPGQGRVAAEASRRLQARARLQRAATPGRSWSASRRSIRRTWPRLASRSTSARWSWRSGSTRRSTASTSGMYLANSTFAQLEPSSTLNNGRATDPNSNNSLFQNDAVLAADRARRRQNRTLAKRKVLYSQLNDILLDESFIMVLAGAPPTLVARSKVNGIEPSAHDGFYYHNTWLTP